jgi:beta-xylosidase
MSPDGRKLLDEGVTVYAGPVAEGTKFYKMNGYYYISIPEGGVSTGWQTIKQQRGHKSSL